MKQRLSPGISVHNRPLGLARLFGCGLIGLLALAVACLACPAAAEQAPPLPRSLSGKYLELGSVYKWKLKAVKKLKLCQKCKAYFGFTLLGAEKAGVSINTYDGKIYNVTTLTHLMMSPQEGKENLQKLKPLVEEKYLLPYKAHLITDKTKADNIRTLCFRDQNTILVVIYGESGLFTAHEDLKLTKEATGVLPECSK